MSGVKRFQTKIVQIDAIRFTAESAISVHEFAQESDGTERFRYGFNKDGGVYEVWGEIYDVLHDTWIKVSEGQWIIKGTKGEFYPCDDETFHWKYEQVNRWNKDNAEKLRNA